jgi:cytidine deaminase
MDPLELISAATEAAKHSYSPYSNFRVGAALLSKSGKIYTGCNVENASYGLANCAERTAVFKAISEGERDFEMMAISSVGGVYPCGACRQVLNEFAPDLKLVLGDFERNLTGETSLRDLLPNAFGPEFKKD